MNPDILTNTTGFWISKMVQNDTENYDDSTHAFMNSVELICVILLAGVLLREVMRKFHFPYTILLFVFGCILGIFDLKFPAFHSYTTIAKTGLLMNLLLPAIIYQSAYGVEPHMFYMALSQILILAVPGLVLCTVLTGVFAKTVLQPYGWDWIVCFVFGSILSSTDPTAVVPILTDTGISPSLTTVIDGESMINSGAAIVIFEVLNEVVEGTSKGAQDVIFHLLRTTVGGVVFGYIVAIGAIALLRRTENDTDVEVTFSFCIAYITYFTSDLFLKVSGILSVVVLGVCISNYKSSINYEEKDSTIHQFWESLSFWANTLIFTVVGIIIMSTAANDFSPSDIGFIIATYVAVSVFRAVMVLLLTPFLRNRGYGFSWNYAAVLTWSGLRGSIGLALVLLFRYSVPQHIANKFLIQVSGVIVLTLAVNATTMNILFKVLGIGQVTTKNIKSMAHALALLRDAVNATESVARMDKYLAGADWTWVRKVTYIKNPYENLEYTHKGIPSATDKTLLPSMKDEEFTDEMKAIQEESRQWVLRSMEVSLYNQHIRYSILRRTLSHLSTAIEETLDVPQKYLFAKEVKRRYLRVNTVAKYLKLPLMGFFQRLSVHIQLHKDEMDKGKGFQKWCLSFYLSRTFEPIVFWILVLNVVPIAAQADLVFRKFEHSHITQSFKFEVILYEIFNGILAIFFLFETTIRLGALGFRQYMKSHSNKFDFLVAIIAIAHTLVAIVLGIQHEGLYHKTDLYIFFGLGLFRILRLIRVSLSGILASIVDNLCSVYYNAYDLAVGFIVANEDIAKTAKDAIEYEPSYDLVSFNAEKNILQMLSYLEDFGATHSQVVCAWKTHGATVKVLRDMKSVIEEMLDIYMIDEEDAEFLKEEINLKMKDALSAPKYKPVQTGARCILEHLQWIKNEEMLDMILQNCALRSYSKDTLIQDVGHLENILRIVYKGVLQISGENDGFKSNILPNIHSAWYFMRTEIFSQYVITSETIGLLGYLLDTPTVTFVTAATDCELLEIDYAVLKEAEEKFGDLSYEMWRNIALDIGFIILSKEENYEKWSDEKIKIHLEGGIFPELNGIANFHVHDVITDMLLIQGKIRDDVTNAEYIGPDYVPRSVRDITLLDNPTTRPRVVMILLREAKVHSKTIIGWKSPSEISYKGLCMAHGLRKTSLYDEELMHTKHKKKQMSLAQTITRKFTKDEKILQSETA